MLLLAVLWAFWWRERLVLQIEVPGATPAQVYVEVNGIYNDGLRFETRELVKTYLPANGRNVVKIPSALPWRFDSLQVRVFHPAVLGSVSTVRSNPHWWRASLALAPTALAPSPATDSIAIGVIERHYDEFERLYVRGLTARDAAREAWPHLATLRMMTVAASFRLERGDVQPPDVQAERLRKLMDRWVALETSLRETQFQPCTEPGVAFRNEIPDVTPACGLKAMLPPP